MSDDSLMEWTFKGMVTVTLTAGGWFMALLVKSVGKNRDDIVQAKNDLAEHRLLSANTFATKTDLNSTMGAINETMRRVHERIDGIFELLNGQKK